MKLSDIVLCIEDLMHLLGCLFMGVLKLVLVLAIVLAPYALDAAFDKLLGNSLPPTIESEVQP